MPTMGTFRTSIALESPARRGVLRELDEALVDTGSEFTWVPAEVLRALGVREERVQRFLLADGTTVERTIGFAIVHAAGSSTADDVVFAEPGDMLLLGARSLEGLNLRVDARAKRLVPAGPIVTASTRERGLAA